MPWALSLKHLLGAKNQIVAKLWITPTPHSQSTVGFSVNDRSPMPSLTMSAILKSRKHDGLPVDVVFRGGQHRRLMVRSVGEGWFSAQATGISSSELVVTFAAVSLVTGDFSELDEGCDGSPIIPLGAMLVQLERQRTQVSVNLRGVTLLGCVNAVRQDCLSLLKPDGISVLIPLTAMLWLETCG